MSFKKLQIKLLSKSGELLNVVNCMAGHVTVLRSNTHAELQPYQRALSGVPGPEKFSINLDSQEFKVEEHTLVGFGKDIVESSTVAKYLASFGVPKTALKSVLMSYGLEKYADQSMQIIGDCPQRRVQLLAATYTPDKVLILNNPFQPISNEWKDAFAELVLTFAKNKAAIVVVTSLSFRPQSWIGNELIARVQVGSTLQRTIGFGSDQDTMREMLEKVRSSTNPNEDTDSPAPEAATVPEVSQRSETEYVNTGDLVKRASQSWMGIAFVLCTLSLSLGAGGLWYLKTSQEEQLATIVVPEKAPVSEQNVQKAEVTPTTAPVKETEPVVTTKENDSKSLPIPENVGNTIKMVLDTYNSEVKKTVLATFKGQLQRAPVTAKREPMGKRIETKQANSPKGFDLLNALEKATGTGKGLPDYIPDSGSASSSTTSSSSSTSSGDKPDFNSMSKEERRALLREKFRQAIERAQQRKQNQ